MAEMDDAQEGVDSSFHMKNFLWVLATGGILVQVGSRGLLDTGVLRFLSTQTLELLTNMSGHHQTNASLVSQVP